MSVQINVTIKQVKHPVAAIERQVEQVAPYRMPILTTYCHFVQTDGQEEVSVPIHVAGSFEQETGIFAYDQPASWLARVAVYEEQCNVYKPQILQFLPAEFELQDVNQDLRQYLKTVAISADEFYCFIKDFTDIFDPDRCEPKYLSYLAKLINYPLNTRGFEDPSQAVRDAAIGRARRQLRQAVEVYKRKGLKEAFQILFYSLGYYVELVELWTNNYVTFHAEVPSNETLYHAEKNPNGWYKSPYFGVKLVSINQQTVCTAANGPTSGMGQSWHFNADDAQEILDALHSIRPVHTVLYWINYYMDLCDKFDEWDTYSFGGTVSWEPNDKFFNCQPDDPLYYRLDERLLGRSFNWGAGGYDPAVYVSRNGTDALAANMTRDPQPGFCDPDIGIEAELGDINWLPDPYAGPITRDCGLLYRNGYNMHPRNGEVTTRDPSCFQGRNGGYWRDTPLAPFTAGLENQNDLVWDRSGLYTPITASFEPLYQIAEEAEDGITLYYNKHEFKNWLDTVAAGLGPDPDLTGLDTGTPPAVSITQPMVDPRAAAGNVLLDDVTSLYSFFGITGGNYTRTLSKYTFASALLSNISAVTPINSLTDGYADGFVGYYGGKFHYILGNKGTTVASGVNSEDYLIYDPVANTLVKDRELTGFARHAAASAQVGTKLYVFGGLIGAPGSGVEQDSCLIFNMMNGSIASVAMPFTASSGQAVTVNEFIYIYCRTTGQLWQFDTITETFTLISTSPVTTSVPRLIKRNSKLMVFADSWSDGFTKAAYLEFDMTTSVWSMRTVANGSAQLSNSFVLKNGRFYGCGADFFASPSSVVQVIDFIR